MKYTALMSFSLDKLSTVQTAKSYFKNFELVEGRYKKGEMEYSIKVDNITKDDFTFLNTLLNRYDQESVMLIDESGLAYLKYVNEKGMYGIGRTVTTDKEPTGDYSKFKGKYLTVEHLNSTDVNKLGRCG